jgi:hypothetical protein
MDNTRSISYSICQYGGHPLKQFGSSYFYTDEKHGINDTISICQSCYAKHILEHYPDSRIAEHIRKNPDNYVEQL